MLRTSLMVLLVMLLGVMGLASCASSPKPQPSETGVTMRGVEISFFVTTEPGRHEYYIVEPDGRIGFGGGNDAVLNRTSWDGVMSQAQADELQAVLKEHDLLSVQAVSAREPDRLRWRVEIRHPGGRIRHRTTGQCDALEALRAQLADISRARLDSFLERLPQAPDDEG